SGGDWRRSVRSRWKNVHVFRRIHGVAPTAALISGKAFRNRPDDFVLRGRVLCVGVLHNLDDLVGPPTVWVQFLKPSIYQEVVCWAAAIAAAYVYCAVYGLVIRNEFSDPLVVCMFFLAGLALLNRVSTGLGLYLSTGLLLLTFAWQARPLGQGTERN